jgi:pyruvate/2-oxoglutarate dehydrogenase complex dihydrolipoamide acyltransferase (E2) component
MGCGGRISVESIDTRLGRRCGGRPHAGQRSWLWREGGRQAVRAWQAAEAARAQAAGMQAAAEQAASRQAAAWIERGALALASRVRELAITYDVWAAAIEGTSPTGNWWRENPSAARAEQAACYRDAAWRLRALLEPDGGRPA